MNGSSVPHTPSEGRPAYVGLREKAVEVLAEAPDGLDGAGLAQRLFGSSSGDRWIALLPVILADETRLESVDGRWCLKRLRRGTHRADATPATPPNCDRAQPSTSPAEPGVILTLALATTGADPRRHRIARIAIVRHEHGEITARLDYVVSSGRRLSRYLSDAARVAPEDLDESPTFDDIVPGLRELMEGQVVHAYGARRAQAFLEAEARRADVPALDLHLVELDTVVRPLLLETGKPGLFAAAEELGIQHNGQGSPLAEAELGARVLARVRERLIASPPRPTMDLDSEPADPTRPLPFTREWLRSVPEGPGVYIFEDEAGRALYVGKAKSLYRRLSAYVGRQPSLHRRLEGLAVRAGAATTIAAPSDLEASLLEARLIRERRPSFNVARQTRPPATLVRAAPDAPSPSVRLVSEVAADGARYIGPFETVSAARHALDVAREAYPEAFPRRRGDVDRQRQAVLQVCRLLSGQKQPTLEMLRHDMQAAASAGDRAEVDRLRAALRDVQALDTRHSDLAGLDDGWRLLVLEQIVSGLGRLHLVHDRRLIGSADTDTSTLPTDPTQLRRLAHQVFGQAENELSDDDDDQVSRPESWSPEDSTILMRWLVQARPRLEIQRLPTDDGDDSV